MKKKDTERLTFDAPKDMAKEIRTRADKQGLSMADILRMVIRKGLAA